MSILILVALLASHLPELKIETSTESYLHPNDPTMLAYNEFKHQFGRDELIVIGIDEPSTVFSKAFLTKLKKFHEALEQEVPHVEEVLSMVNVRNIRGEQDSLIVEDLFRSWPEDEKHAEAFKESVLSNERYVNNLISEDGRVSAIVIKSDVYSGSNNGVNTSGADLLNGFNAEKAEPVNEPVFLTDAENHALVESIQKVCMRFEAPDFHLYVSGSPVVIDSLRRSLISDANRFVKIALLMIAGCLFLMFRRVSGVLLPLVIVTCALVSTLSLMPILNVSFTVPCNILPSFILVVGLADSVHILSIFYRFHEKTGDRKLAVRKALGHSGIAVVLTSLTTAAGLASLITAEVAPIAHLGVFSSIGVMLALIFSVGLLPALLSIVPMTKKYSIKRGTRYFGDRFFVKLSDFSVEHNKGITLWALVITAVSVTGLFRLSFSHNPMVWLPETMPIRTDTEKIDQELKGTVVLEVIIDTGRANGLHDPNILNTMDALADEFKTFRRGEIFVGKVSSIADILKEIHQALNENRAEYYAIPQSRKVISQEFLLFENSGSDVLSEFVDRQFSRARLTMKVPWGDAIEYMPVLRSIEDRFKEAFAGTARITATGMMSLLVRVFYAAMHSAARSYLIAFGVISLMMILLMGNLRLGLLSMIPNLLPIVLSLGFIGWLDFPLDMFTMLIGNIAIGLAVDDTVHFMHNFRRYFALTKDVREATRRTFLAVGRPMVVTSIVLSAGFFIYMFATMKNLFYFGLITGITIITALLADLLVAPAVMALAIQRIEPVCQIRADV